jgi:nitrogen fixation NifU-like protein
MKLQIKVNKDGIIEKAVFKAFGCGSAIASASYTTELLNGMHIDKAILIKNNVIASHLNLQPVKLHCSLLAEDSIKSAVENYKQKNK